MMRNVMVAAVAAAALAACNMIPGLGGGGGTGPALPAPQAGVQAPTVLTPPETAAQRGRLDDATRTALTTNITQLLDAEAQQFAAGMSPPQGFSDEIATMEPRTDHRWQFNLTAGQPYTIIGACDGDCTNVDIELIDSRGGVVASDLLPDDYPVVTYTPETTGVFYARALMQACTVAPCYAGMRVLTPGPGGGGK